MDYLYLLIEVSGKRGDLQLTSLTAASTLWREQPNIEASAAWGNPNPIPTNVTKTRSVNTNA